MKIKTITCHNVYNYGASLQAFALQYYLQQQGHDVEIINYRPWYNRDGYDLFAVPEVSWTYKITRRCSILRYIAAPIRNRHLLWTYGRKEAFDKFTGKMLRTTAVLYPDIDTLRSNPPDADVYIAGSDQIWNPDMQNGWDPAFYLDFGKSSIRRLSYAASFGIDNIKPESKDFIRTNLSKFEAIAVREKTGLSILNDLGFTNSEQVLDPVFLLTSEQWRKVVISQAKKYNLKSGEYILLYDFINDDKVRDFVKLCSKVTGLPIIAINDLRRNSCAKRNINNAGPLEFVSLISNAAVVVSNSFHATAFSCIFDKDFYTFPLSTQRNSSRMTDLLSSLGVMERFSPTSMTTCHIDHVHLRKEMNRSMYFLDKNLTKKII